MPKGIKMKITHAHIDHFGRVPNLIDVRFSGEIICTHGTKVLLLTMLRDAMSFSGSNDPQVRVIVEGHHSSVVRLFRPCRSENPM